MDVAIQPLFIAFVLVAISGIYFRKGKGLTLIRRIAASAHGVLAILIFPVGVAVDKRLIESESAVAGIGINSCLLLAIVSVIYSFKALKDVGYLHFVHVLTIGGAILIFFLVGLGLFGPG